VYVEPTAYTFTSIAVFPSNADLVFASKLGAIAPGSVQTDNLDAYSPWELLKATYGTTPAPKGKAIIDIFKRQQTGSSLGREFSMFPLGGTLIDDYSVGGINSVSAYAGRMWYTLNESYLVGGDSLTPHISNLILYSQASDDLAKWGSCHTVNDPSSQEFSDVLASDGGFVSIPEAGNILKTVPLGESLFVFATNGVWEIFGGDTTFSAIQQSVLKVTDKGCIAKKSIVVGGNFIGYWSESGIYGISLGENTLRGIATNVTEETIQTFYDGIPVARKQEVKGVYDSLSRQISWLYSLEDKGSVHYFDRELLFDVLKKSFTKRKLAELTKTTGHGPYVVEALNLQKVLIRSSQEALTDGAVAVTDGGVAVTTTVSGAKQQTKSSVMYWIANYNGTNEYFRLGGYLNFDFVDYPLVQDSSSNFGADAEAFIVTGYLTGGDSSREKYLPYITVNSKRTESDWTIDGSGNITVIGESSCKMQAQWEWTNNALSGKWSTIQEVYRLPRFFTLDDSHIFSFDVVSTRNKVKGSGKALSLKFSSSPNKDMYILGWGVDVEVKSDM